MRPASQLQSLLEGEQLRIGFYAVDLYLGSKVGITSALRREPLGVLTHCLRAVIREFESSPDSSADYRRYAVLKRVVSSEHQLYLSANQAW